MTVGDLMEKLKTMPETADVVMRVDTDDGLIFVGDLMGRLVPALEDELAPPPYCLTLKNCLGVPSFLFEQSNDAQPHQGVHEISEIAQCSVFGHAADFEE